MGMFDPKKRKMLTRCSRMEILCCLIMKREIH